LENYIFAALAALIALTAHEYCHGYAAYRLGDPTAKSLGRLTLNPIRHLDPIGALCMILFHFGWAKPVPINPRYFKNPKKGFAIVALAGPAINLILSFLSAGAYLLLWALVKDVAFTSELWFNVAKNGLSFLFIFHSLNLGFALFNLIPIPPLDGSRLLSVILPPKQYFGLMRYERYIYFGLLGWLFIGDFLYSALLRFSLIAESSLLASILKVISLSELLSGAMQFISDAMMWLWQLIPFLA
jgi:Zn-dependent protease